MSSSSPRFRRLQTWFLLSVASLVVAFLLLLLTQIEALGLIGLAISAWLFVVWTVGVGVRVGMER
jgi:hypothetical protein